MTGMKHCNKCGTTKPTSEFGKFHRAPDGLNHKCRECVRAQSAAWRSENAERAREMSKAWTIANPEKRKLSTKSYREANAALIKAQSTDYLSRPEVKASISEKAKVSYANNRGKFAESSRRWATANPEKVRAKGARWAKNNPDKVREKCARRRAHIRFVGWNDESKVQALYAKARRLSRSTGVPHEVDHVYPIRSKVVSGLHVHTNLQVLPAAVNRSKKNKLPGHLAHELWDPTGPGVFHVGVAK